MVTTKILDLWLNSACENEHLEFKEAKLQFDTIKLMRYCVALANEGGGYLVLGISDKPPRKIVGTSAFNNVDEIKSRILHALHIRVDVTELYHTDKRIVVFKILARPIGQPIHFEGSYWMRSGQELTPMTPDQLKKIFNEGRSSFLEEIAKESLKADQVIDLLDTQTYFDLLNLPFPSTQGAILSRLIKENLIKAIDNFYAITNLGALLLAKNLDVFETIYRKAPRVILYKTKNKLHTIRDYTQKKGYAVGYTDLLSFVNSQLPANEIVSQAFRQETLMYPKIAIRELIANALIHQDFEETGMSPMIEIYPDRIEISNPGVPLIPVERFLDEYKSRNERLASLMRRFGICEEKSSGIDNVVSSTEIYQLPAPDFKVGMHHTTAILFSYQEFAKMERADRSRACYLHCCLKYISNEKMTNQSLRERFQLSEEKAEAVSRTIIDTVNAGKIKLDNPENLSKRYAKYIPYWA